MPEWSIRQTTGSDRAAVDGLLANATHTHLHLDWLDPAQLTDREPFLLAFDDGRPVACLAAPPDTPGVAWLRAFAGASDRPAAASWDLLWPAAAEALAELEVVQVAAMALDRWLADLLTESGFSQENSVVFLELELGHEQAAAIGDFPARGRPQARRSPQAEGAAGGPSAPRRAGSGRLDTDERLPTPRPIRGQDLAGVLALDAAAFAPMWRLSARSMQAALAQASSATLLEWEGAVVGYQITTSSPFSVHLARLAVGPEWQRQGLGGRLVADSIRTAAAQPLGRLSVNTQADNAASLALYARLGFKRTGQQFPVYTLELSDGRSV